jgi:hypothetical protein
MDNKKVIKYSEYLFSGIFFTGIFTFFAFFYNSHLHFQEQFQLFLLTKGFFISKLGFPGGCSGYIGGFLTQFYYLTLAGPLIIAGLLFTLQQVLKRILQSINSGSALFPVSFVPSLLAGMILCNEFYPLSAITGFLLAMASGLVYVRIKKGRSRFASGLALIPLTYWLAGGSHFSLLMLMLMYELLQSSGLRKKMPDSKKAVNSDNFRLLYSITYILIAAGIPLLVRQYFILQPLMMAFLSEFYYNIPTAIPVEVLVLFTLPTLLMLLVWFISLKEKNFRAALAVQIAAFTVLTWFGFKSFANFEAEQIMTYDYFVRNEQWKDVLKYADKKPPRNFLSLAMLNLSLAKTGQLGNRMFQFDQHGVNGLFLSFNREYVAPIMGNEIFYHLGLTNASQQYAFESMETIPGMGKSVRVIKRLAETNLINGHYKVSEKYLKLLGKTIFYRKWAKSTITYLNNEEKINNDPVWGEKRRFMVRSDYFFHVKNIEAVLNRMVKEHPNNKIAFEYLMAYYMVNKDLRNFVTFIPVMEKMQYSSVPISYQEAILFILALNNQDPITTSPAYISNNTKLRMKSYTEIYTTFTNTREKLEKQYGKTYWFYLHFGEVESGQVEEKKDNTGST